MNIRSMPAKAGASLLIGAAITTGGVVSATAATPHAVKATNGVTVSTAPKRIVSLSPAATEDLYAIGAGRQVVAVDEYSTIPKGTPRTSLDGYSPNAEAIARYRPDLVVISDNEGGIESQLKKLDIPVQLESAPNKLAGAYGEILQLGKMTGHAAQSRKVVAKFQATVAKAVKSVRKASLSVYYEVGIDPYYSAGSNTFIGQVFKQFGLKNIADAAARKTGSDYPSLSSEAIVAANPSLIVLSDEGKSGGQSARTVAKRNGWSQISAVKHGHIIGVNATVASNWGPEFAEIYQQVAAELQKLKG